MTDDELAHVRNREIGFVFQTFNLLPRADALHNVELPLIYRGSPGNERRKKSMQALESVGHGDRVHHNPNEMSGGQRQRVAIARALYSGPALVLADEPTGNLDTVTGGEVLDLFRDLNAEGVAFLVVTHEAETTDRARRFKFHGQTSGADLTRQQPLNNIARVTTQAIAGILGGLQSLHTDAYDEVINVPNEDPARIAIATQNILREEAGLCDRSEEHTSDLQSLVNLVCRLRLEKKNHLPAARTSTVRTP